MDTQRMFLAVVISFIILFGYQYLFVGFEQPQPVQTETQSNPVSQDRAPESIANEQDGSTKTVQEQPVEVVTYDREPQKVVVDTPLYTAEFSEDGGMLTSFVLKKYRKTGAKNSPGMQLVATTKEQGFPLGFSWGSVAPERILYTSSEQSVALTGSAQNKAITFSAKTGDGVEIKRVYTFNSDTYLIDLAVTVTNSSGSLLQGEPRLAQISGHLGSNSANSSASRFLFSGPSAYISGELHEMKPADFADAPVTLNGSVDWAGYESNYFLCMLLPLDGVGESFTMSGDENRISSMLKGKLATLKSGDSETYSYKLYYGPKKLSLLKKLGYNLDKALSFGWFTMIAKPMLWLLNMFYMIFRNYGVAIILVTIVIKSIFWPISQKGMKSMKNMQKLQPKMAKIREKYKDDPQTMNREVMSLYKTYKVNPLGGCLPMLVQIPFFFALYRVLLQSIELRQAPFMLWINDLAAPDRLWAGLNLPVLGGIPVLTILMGASMWLQQKMTPTTADPTQAKVMMFLPILFTFMFLNFPSGLVLYWLVNNLLSILQQVLINKERKEKRAA